jgi:hypothetical protein
MNVKSDRVVIRFSLFKRVLSEAAKSPPLSPALHAYKAASSDAECRDAYATMTAIDRNALVEEATKLMRARDEAAAAEFRAVDAKIAPWNTTRIAKLRAAETARIANLPVADRRRAKFSSTISKVASYIGNSLGWLLVALFIIGNVVSFVFSLLFQWAVWLLLVGTCLSIYLVVMLAVHWGVIISVFKSLPAAISAAIYGDRNGQGGKGAPNPAAPADQKAPLPGR